MEELEKVGRLLKGRGTPQEKEDQHSQVTCIIGFLENETLAKEDIGIESRPLTHIDSRCKTWPSYRSSQQLEQEQSLNMLPACGSCVHNWAVLWAIFGKTCPKPIRDLICQV